MGTLPTHIACLTDTGSRPATACGKAIDIWELALPSDESVLSAWAKHFREHYCSDEELPAMIQGTGKSSAEYFRTILFPDASAPPGPSVRSGDFGEILVGDFIEYVLGYWCPRALRYQDRWNRNDSTKGCDIVGFKFVDGPTPNAGDELFIFESKSGCTETNKNRLQDAIDDSKKDVLREAMTLNALKQRLIVRSEMADAALVERFQNESERPFSRVNGAAAILDDDVFATTNLAECDTATHPNNAQLRLLVIRGPSLMKFIHALYERAADEA